jgi:hypothetical protein
MPWWRTPSIGGKKAGKISQKRKLTGFGQVNTIQYFCPDLKRGVQEKINRRSGLTNTIQQIILAGADPGILNICSNATDIGRKSPNIYPGAFI